MNAENGDGVAVLTMAVLHNHIDCIPLLVNEGAELNHQSARYDDIWKKLIEEQLHILDRPRRTISFKKNSQVEHKTNMNMFPKIRRLGSFVLAVPKVYGHKNLRRTDELISVNICHLRYVRMRMIMLRMNEIFANQLSFLLPAKATQLCTRQSCKDQMPDNVSMFSWGKNIVDYRSISITKHFFKLGV